MNKSSGCSTTASVAAAIGLDPTRADGYLHGWQSASGGIKPTYLKDHGHTVLNPKLPDDDFDAAVRIAQDEFGRGEPDVVVGSSRGEVISHHWT